MRERISQSYPHNFLPTESSDLLFRPLINQEPIVSYGVGGRGVGGVDLDQNVIEQREKEWENLLSSLYDLAKIKEGGDQLPDRITIKAKGGSLVVTHDEYINKGPGFIVSQLRTLSRAARGLPPEYIWDDKKIADVTNRIEAGNTNAEIAKELGTTIGAVKSALHRARSKGKDIPPRRVDREKLLCMLQQGAKRKTAAKVFNVSTKTIRRHEKHSSY